MMGLPNKTLQYIVDISNAIDKALQGIELPEGFSINTSTSVIKLGKDTIIANITNYPESKMEATITLQQY